MAKNLKLWALILVIFSSSSAIARTPIETFIYHVKEDHSFVPVNNVFVPDNDFDKSALLNYVTRAQILTLNPSLLNDVMKQDNIAMDFTVPGINGGSYTLELAKYDFRADGFTVHVDGGNGQGRDFSNLDGLFYRGVVQGYPGSLAAFSFFNDQVYGIFSIPGLGNFVIGSYSGNADSHYILYNNNDLNTKYAPQCHTDELQQPQGIGDMMRTTSLVNEKVMNSCKQVKVFEVADHHTYTTKVNTAGTTKYIASLFNIHALVYKNEGITISLKYVQIDSATDTYSSITSTNSGDWLDAFGFATQTNLHGANVAILLSTVNSYMGGIAWISTLCGTYNPSNNSGPYAFCNVDGPVSIFPTLSYNWDVNVTTHEMGHVLGSPHTHGCYWNGNNTAIDGCYTIEGSCPIPTPQYPPAGGTIMSYCHLVSGVGVNFSNGFGPQPGNVIRTGALRTCDTVYFPNSALAAPGKTFSANNECTDPTSGITYYWYDSATASQLDDKLVLMIKKGGTNIGNLDSPGFTISTSTLSGYGSGTAQATTFPSGTATVKAKSVAYNRYWKMSDSKTLTSAVEVIFPFTPKDSTDLYGSISSSSNFSNDMLYTVNGTIDPNPANNFLGATPANITSYIYGSTPGLNTWSLSKTGGTYFAHIKMTDLNGGGSIFNTSWPTALSNANGTEAGITVFPNPARDNWYINITKPNAQMTLELYAADGKMVISRSIQTGTTEVNITSLPTGMYFYRIVNNEDVYTGKLQKQ